MKKTKWLLIGLCLFGLLVFAPGAQACGGFFCQNVPVDQSAERIIFAVNDNDSTIDAYVQINYTGSPDNFAWVVPVPNPPKVDVADISMIRELDRLTQPVYIAPPLSDSCRQLAGRFYGLLGAAPAATSAVTVFGQGSVGPYNYAIVGSDDPQELVKWLRTNQYQITPAMEPLVDVYVKEKMVFLAMKLQPQKQVRDIQPVKMTYKSTKPMIPLRLTAVAANPNMVVLTWILARAQAEPENYAVFKIPDEQIVFTAFGGSNYSQVVLDNAKRLSGRAFITEFAGATSKLNATDAGLKSLLRSYPYLTRVYARISPEEMTIDPVFKFNSSLPDVSNVHDLSKDPNRIWDCNGTQVSNRASNLVEVTTIKVTDNYNPVVMAIYIAGACIALALGFVGFGLIVSRRRA